MDKQHQILRGKNLRLLWFPPSVSISQVQPFGATSGGKTLWATRSEQLRSGKIKKSRQQETDLNLTPDAMRRYAQIACHSPPLEK